MAHSCDASMQIFWDEINNYGPDDDDDLSRFVVSDSGSGYDGENVRPTEEDILHFINAYYNGIRQMPSLQARI